MSTANKYAILWLYRILYFPIQLIFIVTSELALTRILDQIYFRVMLAVSRKLPNESIV